MKNDQLIKPILIETTSQGIEIYFVPLVEYTSIYENGDGEYWDEILEKINNYELQYFTASVYASYKGIEIASDYLGGCIYDSFEDFYIKYKDDYFADMVNTVKTEGIQYLKDLQAELYKLNLK